MPSNDQLQRLTAVALSSLTDTPKMQLQDWLEKPQTHEQFGAQGKSALNAAEMEAFLRFIEEKIAGNTS